MKVTLLFSFMISRAKSVCLQTRGLVQDRTDNAQIIQETETTSQTIYSYPLFMIVF